MARNWRAAGGDALAKGLTGAGDLLFGGGADLRETVSLRIADVMPNPAQPRRHFDESELQQLADSLKAVGQLSPILVKPHPEVARRYLLVAGERRWRAAGLAGLATVAAHVLPAEADTDQVALIENLQRVNLSPVEEAEGIQRLIDRHGYAQEQAGALLGRSRTEINTTLSLLRLHETIRRACVTSHTDLSKALLLEIARMAPEEQLAAWDHARGGGLTVRAARSVRRTGAAAPVGERGRPGGALGRRLAAVIRRLQADVDAELSALEAAGVGDRDRRQLDDLRAFLEDALGRIDRILSAP